MDEIHEFSKAKTRPASSPIFQSLQELAERYRRSNSIEEKEDYRQSLDLILKHFPNDDYDHDLRKCGLPELVLQAALETRSVVNKGSPTANMAFGAISTLQMLVTKINLLSDGYIFAQTLLTNFESIARQIIELAEQPELGISDIYDPILRIISALLSNDSYLVMTSATGPSILRVLLESLLRPVPENLPLASRWNTYKLLTCKLSGKPGAVAKIGDTLPTMLRELRTEAKAILSRYSTQHVVTQLARSVGGTQNETSLWQFYEVVYGLLLIDQSLQVNLLRHGKLHVHMANAWWKVGGVATVPIRPDDVSAAISWDPAALSCIEELLSAVESPEIQREVIGDLINEADLVLLLGRVQASRKYYFNAAADSWYSTKWLRSVIQRLGNLCTGNRHLIDGRIQSDWLYLAERLAAISRCPPVAPDSSISLRHRDARDRLTGESRKIDLLDMWAWTGHEIGLDTSTILENDVEARRNKPASQVGCYWVRCPLYGEDLADCDGEVLQCTGCRTTFYCSPGCQKAHWKQGNHRVTCREETAPIKALTT